MTQQTPNTELPITHLTVTGMTCGHCVKAVEGALRDIPGVQTVRVDLASGQATVEGSADQDAMLAAVTAEGYAAQVTGA